jgi:hypothetical protein
MPASGTANACRGVWVVGVRLDDGGDPARRVLVAQERGEGPSSIQAGSSGRGLGRLGAK